MTYYFMHNERKIPSLLAYSLIIALAVGLSLLLRNANSTTIVSRARPQVQPKNILTTNITNSSAAVSFTTDDNVRALVAYDIQEKEKPNFVAFDIRDINATTERKIHYFTLTNLNENTQYSVKININGKLYPKNKFIKFRTYTSADIKSSQQPIFGKVLNEKLKPIENALVAVTLKQIKDSPMFTTLSKSTGSWIISMPIIKKPDGSVVKLNEDDEVIIIITAQNKKTIIKTSLKNARPLRSVILGENYTNTQNSKILGASQKKTSTNLQIIFPKNNSIISSRYIQFRGSAKPNTQITLEVSPVGIQEILKSNNQGVWKYQNTLPLTAGTYTATASSETEGAVTQVSFNIGKDGEKVLGDATQSAELTNTPTTQLSPTATPQTTPTQLLEQPQQENTSSEIAQSESATPTPTTVITTVTPAQQENIPQTGFSTNLLIVAATSLSLLGFVLLLY